MNILYTSYYTEGRGGAELSMAIVASAIQKLGHNALIASSESYGCFGLKTIKFRKYAKVPIFRLHEEYLSRFFKKIIAENKIDIVHANDRLTSVPAILAAKRCGVPVAVQLRDYWFACPKSTLLRRDGTSCSGCSLSEIHKCSASLWRIPWDAYKLNYLKRARRVLNNADMRIAASNTIKEKAEMFNILDTIVIPNPVGPEFFSPCENDDLRETLGLSGTTITYIGALDYSKGIMELLEVMIKLIDSAPNTSFLIVGNGRLSDKIQRRIAGEGLGKRIIVLGGLPHARMPEIYSCSDIIAVPSVWDEPFGRVCLEAMAAGKPVLASAAGGLREVIKDEWCLIPVFDSAAWDSKLRALISDKKMRERLGSENKKCAEAYAPEKIARQLIKEYDRIKNA